LGDNQKANGALQFFIQTTNKGFAELFGKNHGNEDKAALQRCEIQDVVFRDPLAYIGIYSPSQG
jgi:hypothetical protein